MNLTISDIRDKVRIAIDEIVKDREDDFTKDADIEIEQAIRIALTGLLQEAPSNMLVPVSNTTPPQEENADGSGYIVLPGDFLRFVQLRLSGWYRTVNLLIDPLSDESWLQNTPFGRGTPQKPKAMLSFDSAGEKILKYWTATKQGGAYNHTIEKFLYVSTPEENNGKINTCLRDEAEKVLIYRAAGIFLESKKEGDLASRMYALATFD